MSKIGGSTPNPASNTESENPKVDAPISAPATSAPAPEAPAPVAEVSEDPILGRMRHVTVTAAYANALENFTCGISNDKVHFQRVGLPFGKPVWLPQAVVDLLDDESRPHMQADDKVEGGFRLVHTPANHIKYHD